MSTIDVPSVSLLLSYVSGGLGIGTLPVSLIWRSSARRTPALTRLATLLAEAGTRVGIVAPRR